MLNLKHIYFQTETLDKKIQPSEAKAFNGQINVKKKDVDLLRFIY